MKNRVVADVWEKDIWDFQTKSESSGSCRLFLHFLGEIAVQKIWENAWKSQTSFYIRDHLKERSNLTVFYSVWDFCREWFPQTKPKKVRFANFRGRSPELFPESSRTSLSSVWFAGTTPDFGAHSAKRFREIISNYFCHFGPEGPNDRFECQCPKQWQRKTMEQQNRGTDGPIRGKDPPVRGTDGPFNCQTCL